MVGEGKEATLSGPQAGSTGPSPLTGRLVPISLQGNVGPLLASLGS